MPASLRPHVSRAASSRPYDRRSPTASLAQSEIPLVFSRNVPPVSPVQTTAIDIVQNPDGDVPPDHPGLPTFAEYKRIEAGYLHSLSPRKRDKALITQAMFDKIWDVLHQPEACTVETPQFRFWVRKMFTLSHPVRFVGGWGWDGEYTDGTGTGATAHPQWDAEADLELERSMGIGMERSTADELAFSAIVLHENRPVAVMEQLYELFCYCHVRAGHGGRDKTCAVIREHYSWVPKELTAQFVKACPTCALKRSGHVLGVDVEGLTHRRSVRRGRRGRATPPEVGGEETLTPAEPLTMGWPMTGGPLDPANPEPCGVRERDRRQEWLHGREEMGTVGPSCIPSALGSRTLFMQSEIPRALTVDVPPFYPIGSSAQQGDREEQDKLCSAKTGLPSLASALSNESLDENVDLTELGSGDASKCLLPPALRPLRLLRPIPSNSELDTQSYPLQIDPVLLLFDYPRLDLSESSESGYLPDAIPGMSADLGMSSEAHGHQGACITSLSPGALSSMNVPSLGLSRESDSPDSSFERTPLYTTTVTDGADATTTSSFSLVTESMGWRSCGSRYGYRDGPLAMFYHCSADEVGQEPDEPLSFSITTDACHSPIYTS